MAKFVADENLNAALNNVKGKEASPGLTITVCAGAPANRAAALTSGANGLAQTAVDTGGTDLTLADGDTDGRKLTVAEFADISVTNNGDADHVVIVDDTNILLQTTCASTTLSNTGTVTIQTWDWTIRDAT